MGEGALQDQLEHLGEFRIVLHIARRPVSLGLDPLDLLDGEPEQEEVLRAGLFADLDISAVEGADRERAVHHELHVPGARSLFTGGGDLLGEVGRRVDQWAFCTLKFGRNTTFM